MIAAKGFGDLYESIYILRICPPICCHEETHPFYHFLPFSTFLCCHLSSTWLHHFFIPFPETPQVHKLVPCQGLTTGKSQSSRPGLEAVFSAHEQDSLIPWSSHSMERRDRRRRSTQQFQQPRPWDFCALGSALDLDFESQVTGLQRKLCLNYLENSQNSQDKAFADVYFGGEVQSCSCYAFLLYLHILDILDQVVHRQISMIDESHRKAVVAIEFMPATLEVRWL